MASTQVAGTPNITTAPRDHAALLGKSEGGPGNWQYCPRRRGRGGAYQQQIARVRRGLEYEVPYTRAKDGVVRFDGYDAERNVLLDAKDWRRYPPGHAYFWQKKVIKQASQQLHAARGVAIEWHFSSKAGLELVRGVLRQEHIARIRLVLTPKIVKDALP